MVNLRNVAEAEGCILPLNQEQVMLNYYINNEKSTMLNLLGGDGQIIVSKIVGNPVVQEKISSIKENYDGLAWQNAENGAPLWMEYGEVEGGEGMA